MKKLAYTFLILGLFSNSLFCQDLVITLDPISPDQVFLPTYTESTTVNVSGSVTNAGSITTDSFEVKIYFSDGQLLFEETYAGLAPGEVRSFSTSLGLWRDMGLTTYYFTAEIDYLDSAAVDTDETNNTSLATFTIIPRAPDLITVNYDTPVMNGLILSLTMWDFDYGPLGAVAHKIAYYFSTDAVYDPSDKFLKKVSVAPLFFDGDADVVTENLDLSFIQDPGIYYIIVVTDADGEVSELNENNNVTAVGVDVEFSGNDLYIPQLSASPNPVTAGSILNIHGTGTLTGYQEIENLTVNYFLSADSTFAPSNNYLLAYRVYQGVIFPGDFSLDQALGIPAGLANGNYYIIVYIDTITLAGEFSKTNNYRSVRIRVGTNKADLAVSALSTSIGYESIPPGSTLTVTGTGVNNGDVSAQNFFTGYYLSSDSVYSSSDYLLGAQRDSLVSAGSSFSLNKSLFIPPTFANGNYYLIVRLDTANTVTEQNKVNNVKAVKFSIDKANLAIDSFAVSIGYQSLPPGSTLTTTGTGINIGDVEVQTFSTAYYLSSDSLFDSSDYLLDTQIDSLVSGGTSFDLNKSLFIPSTFPNGNYYLIVYLDTANAVPEYNENDNFTSVEITIGPDLVIGSLELFDSIAQPGTFIFVTQTEANLGNVPAGNHYVGYFLSKDAIYDSSDTYLTPNFLVGLNGHDSITLNPALFIPIAEDTGSYFLLSIADYGNDVSEINEHNNIKELAITLNYNYDGTTNVKSSTESTANNNFYPNPTSGIINFTTELVADDIEISNMNGESLLQLNAESLPGTTLDLSQFQSGSYHIKTKKEGAAPTIQKLIIVK